jgi:hypothetical protein
MALFKPIKAILTLLTQANSKVISGAFKARSPLTLAFFACINVQSKYLKHSIEQLGNTMKKLTQLLIILTLGLLSQFLSAQVERSQQSRSTENKRPPISLKVLCRVKITK